MNDLSEGNLFFRGKFSITEQMLKEAYGDRGRTFPTQDEADRYARSLPRARVYPVRDYVGFEKKITCYLVSIEPAPVSKPAGRYTGKVRSD